MLNHSSKFVPALFISAGLLLANCSGDADTNNRSNDSAAENSITETTTPASGCCFTQDADFEPFFPKGNDLIYAKGEKPAANFYCGDTDDPKKSSATLTYQIDTAQYGLEMNAKTISLRIEDHSNNPADIVAKIERKKSSALETKNANVTVKELNSAGLYTGYSWVDASKGNNASNILVEVVVDGRFYVHIQGTDHTRIDLGMQLLEMIPLKELAGKCK